jgi:hypothetical protein
MAIATATNGVHRLVDVLDAVTEMGVEGRSTRQNPPSANGANGEENGQERQTRKGRRGRDAHGRFAKGNKGGPGNPYGRKVAALRKALAEAVSEDDLKDVAAALLLQAKAGDLAAAKLLLNYLVGLPTDPVDPDTLDAQEWRIVQQATVTVGELTTAVNGMPAEVASTVARGMVPKMAGPAMRQFVEQFMCRAGEERGKGEVPGAGC